MFQFGQTPPPPPKQINLFFAIIWSKKFIKGNLDALICILVEEQGWVKDGICIAIDTIQMQCIKNVPPTSLPPGRFMMNISGHFQSSNKIKVRCDALDHFKM